MRKQQGEASQIEVASGVEAPAHRSWRAQRHVNVRLRDGGFLLERCEREPCFVDGVGLAACGRIACPRCGRGSANLSVWQFVELSPNDVVACDCGHTWVPVETTTKDKNSTLAPRRSIGEAISTDVLPPASG